MTAPWRTNSYRALLAETSDSFRTKKMAVVVDCRRAGYCAYPDLVGEHLLECRGTAYRPFGGGIDPNVHPGVRDRDVGGVPR